MVVYDLKVSFEYQKYLLNLMRAIRLLMMMLLVSFSSIAQNGTYGYTNGSSVILRSNHSTSSTKITSLKKGESLEILDEFYPTNNTNEAILRYETRFYATYDGVFVFKLPQGKAVKVIEHLNGGKVKISYTQRDKSKGFATITTDRLHFINGDAWYRVRTEFDKVGWVFGQFVDLEIGD